MSEISENARVIVLLADFANQDPARKINLLGAHWNIAGVQPPGITPPQAVVILVELPSRFQGKEFTLSLVLLDEGGNPMDAPSPAGERQPLRVEQVFRVEPARIPGVNVPTNVPSRVQVILNFPAGIPLAIDRQYRWHVEIDGVGSPQWEANFYVVGPLSENNGRQE